MGGVFANGLEISGKAVSAKTIAAFPDVCMTPPENPVTPTGIPVPYPSFGMASDTEKGTGTVKIGGKTVNIKNKSDESKTSGTEAGCAAKKGVVTSKNTGKKYFNSWSSNVKFDGEAVIRFTDLATHNHASPIANTPPTIEVVGANVAPNPDTSDCVVGSYYRGREECTKQSAKTGKPHQFHHIVPDRTFRSGRRKVAGLKNKRNIRMNRSRFPSHGKGVCICLPAENHCPSSSTPSGTAVVHSELDNKLSALGSKASTAASPKGLTSMQNVRGQCFAALAKLVPNVISKECYKLAVEKVMEQTDGIKDKQVRAEKSLTNISTTARGVMNKQ